MIVKLLTEHHLALLSLKGGCTGSSESTLFKMSNCWKFRAGAHIMYFSYLLPVLEYPSFVCDGCTAHNSDTLDKIQMRLLVS